MDYTDILEYSWQPDMLRPIETRVELLDTLKRFVEDRSRPGVKTTIIVSLSGGVDSMVASYLLSSLRHSHDLELVCVHLNYNNRPETSKEAEFIHLWCQLLRIPLVFHNITELRRPHGGNSGREEYERLTRDIRFAQYKKVYESYSDTNVIGVLLGHHCGDLQENIIFNVMKGRSILDLPVLREEVVQENVKILRPLIHHPKSDILKVAETYRVPYFKNTTPTWSNRGRFRNQILPLLKETFGSGFLTNISRVGAESDDVKKMVYNDIVYPYLQNNVMFLEDSVEMEIVDKPPAFWSYVLKEVFHKYGYSQPSFSILKQFSESLEKKIRKSITFKGGRLEISGGKIIIRFSTKV